MESPLLLLGNLRKTRRLRNEDLMNKTMAVRVRYNSSKVLCRPLLIKNVD